MSGGREGRRRWWWKWKRRRTQKARRFETQPPEQWKAEAKASSMEKWKATRTQRRAGNDRSSRRLSGRHQWGKRNRKRKRKGKRKGNYSPDRR
jgi:hypothetical protein